MFQLSPPGVSTRVTTREHPEAEGETVGEKCPRILPKMPISTLHVKLRNGTDGFTSPSRAEDFFALKIRRLRPGANPQTWVPKASTLPLDHRSRLPENYLHRSDVTTWRKHTDMWGNHTELDVQVTKWEVVIQHPRMWLRVKTARR
jgi:hypothetical protein